MSSPASSIAATRTDASVPETKIDSAALPAAVRDAHGVRFPRLDANSMQDFARGFKIWLSRDGQSVATKARRTHFLEANGLTQGDTALDYEECFDLTMRDPAEAARVRLGWSVHDMMWARALREFEGHRDAYLAAMEETDASGPGTMELDPDLVIPAYAAHEIHRQPGGFVGNEFAGWMYHYCLSLAHYLGFSDHDEVFFRVTQTQPLPFDGVVRRVLDIGCGSGQAVTAFKQRFPQAECWGIDVGGPMVRYCHHRAAKMGFDVHFAQRLAEDTRFPGNHFDIVSDYLLFHEMDAEAARKVIAETFRILRPGGVFGHLDIPTRGHPTSKQPDTIYGKAMLWNIYRHNYEPWYLDCAELDFPALLREAGFELDLSGPPVLWNGRPRTVAVKPA